MTNANDMTQVLLDQVASGQLSRRRFMTVAGARRRRQSSG
jgi:hypothetical protein